MAPCLRVANKPAMARNIDQVPSRILEATSCPAAQVEHDMLKVHISLGEEASSEKQQPCAVLYDLCSIPTSQKSSFYFCILKSQVPTKERGGPHIAFSTPPPSHHVPLLLRLLCLCELGNGSRLLVSHSKQSLGPREIRIRPSMASG